VDQLCEITSPIDKILLSHKFDIPHWLPLAYVSLCKRVEPLSLEEGRRLFELGEPGGDIIILLNQARHELCSRSRTVGTYEGVVKRVFKLDQGEPMVSSPPTGR
jgi:hypothetical protein